MPLLRRLGVGFGVFSFPVLISGSSVSFAALDISFAALSKVDAILQFFEKVL